MLDIISRTTFAVLLLCCFTDLAVTEPACEMGTNLADISWMEGPCCMTQ